MIRRTVCHERIRRNAIRHSPSRHISRFGLASALVIALAAVGCGAGKPANEPGAVADRFVDLYFIEIDQQGVLPLTTGVARARIEEEIEQVQSVRATGYTPNAAKPKIFCERTMLDAAGERARAIYDVRIKYEGTVTHRHVLISLSKRDAGQWKVASFVLQDGKSQRR